MNSNFFGEISFGQNNSNQMSGSGKGKNNNGLSNQEKVNDFILKRRSLLRSTEKKDCLTTNNNLENVFIGDLINNQRKFCIDELEVSQNDQEPIAILSPKIINRFNQSHKKGQRQSDSPSSIMSSDFEKIDTDAYFK